MPLPVSLEEAKDQLRVDDGEQDDAIAQAIVDAAGWVERRTGHILEARDVEERFSDFSRMHLRAWPIAASSLVGIGYAPDGGAATNIFGARLNLATRPATVLPQAGTRWPRGSGAVVVLVPAGYEMPDEVPRDLRRAMLVLIAGYFRDRDGSGVLEKSEAAARRLCSPYRLRRL